MQTTTLWTAAIILGMWLTSIAPACAEPLGIFQNHGDLGAAEPAGEAQFDPHRWTYHVTGGGSNLWFAADAGYFAWKEIAGDLVLAADVAFDEPGGNPHRKAGLMLRQNLEPGSPYVDAVVHGNGLISLQFRETAGGPTREIQAGDRGARQLRLERWGSFFSLSIVGTNGAWRPSGCAIQLAMPDSLLAGLVVCSHDAARLEPVTFRRVQLSPHPYHAADPARLRSVLEVVPIASMDRRVIYHATNHMEAPNWSPDGRFFVWNSGGRIYRLDRDALQPEIVDTGFATRCNNDHGISPDGKLLAISDQSQTGQSLIYTLPIAGGLPRLITFQGPSYWHGWSPDGKSIAYCAERNGEFDVYTIAIDGGIERRLTDAPGLDDGPEYSPEGRTIYFNSERDGPMRIWRMNADGASPRALTSSDDNDWFPHPSPDGRRLAFLSYEPGVKGHPANQPVRIRLMPAAGGEPAVLARLHGGQGTINVPSWSPDSREVAFMSYHPDTARALAQRNQWEPVIRQYENEDHARGCPKGGILFVGSSTIRLWKTIEQDFAGYPVVARGFGGSIIADNTYFVDRIVFPFEPRQIVFYAGDNDLAQHRDPARVLADFEAFVGRVHARLPRTRIAFLPVKPSVSRWAWIDKIRQANDLVQARCARDPRLLYIDTFNPSLGPDGKPRRDWLLADGLHLNRDGYAAWAQIIRPHLAR